MMRSLGLLHFAGGAVGGGIEGFESAETIVELFPKDGGVERIDVDALTALVGVRAARREGAAVVVDVVDTQGAVTALLAHLAETSVELESLHTHAPTLEDVFVALTGRQLRDG